MPVQVPELEPVNVRASAFDDAAGQATLRVHGDVTDGAQLLAEGRLAAGDALRFAVAGRAYELRVRSYEMHLTHDDIAHLAISRLPEGALEPAPPATVASSAPPPDAVTEGDAPR